MFTVKSGNQQVNVELNGRNELTPATARAAVEIAFGRGQPPSTVIKGNKAYRVTASGVRKVDVGYNPDFD